MALAQIFSKAFHSVSNFILIRLTFSYLFQNSSVLQIFKGFPLAFRVKVFYMSILYFQSLEGPFSIAREKDRSTMSDCSIDVQ